MISQMRITPDQTVNGLTRVYIADGQGIVRDVETVDVATLIAAGGETVVLPATLDIVVAPGQGLHFDSASHNADEDGLIRDVPYDVAMIMIRDAAHPAREATAEDLARAGHVKPSDIVFNAGPKVEINCDELDALCEAAALGDSILASLSVKFGGAEMVDTGDTLPPHDDMVFTAVKEGVVLARGTVTELLAFTPPVATPAAPTAPAADAAPAADEPEADTDEGDPLPETAPAAE